MRCATSLVLGALPALLPAQVTTPAEHLGRPLGRDFELADWGEVASWYQRLASESANVQCEVVGRTTEGREFLLATISSAANLERLDELKTLAARIADPRGASVAELDAAVRDGKPILFVSLGMHSTETSPPQFGMELAYRLATSEDEPYKSAREELVCCLIPCTNPDGLDHVVSWYRETVGTPHEASSLLKLYQYYSGHDNNRDWFALTQAETRIVTELLYGEWFPQVYWDVHEQGSTRERFFVPPFRDPLDPNLDPEIIAGIGALGSRALLDMTREGLHGISTGVSYDMWWNGGNRNVPVRHNIVGLLTEAAGVDLATPLFLPADRLAPPRGLGDYAPSNRFPSPWPGGWWRLRDVIEYEHAFARSLLASLAREPDRWLAGALAAAERAVSRSEPATGSERAPRAWVVPSTNADVGAVRRLADLLLASGVELQRASGPVRADGRTWPAGSLVIDRFQPYGTHVKDLFEVQRYPEGDPPYDVAGWTLPLLFGVHRVEVVGELDATLEPIASPDAVVAGWSAGSTARDSDAWRRVIDRLRAASESAADEGARETHDETHDETRGETGWPALVEVLPRIGVYAPWSGSMDEGWLRWVLDEFGLPFISVKNEMLRAGRLADLVDVLVLPDVGRSTLERGRRAFTVPERYTGGLEPEGAVAIEEFVRGGGRLVAVGAAATWAIDLFEVPLVDVTRGDDAREFACPGSVLRAVPLPFSREGSAREDGESQGPPRAENDAAPDADPVRGLAASTAIFFAGGSAWKLADPDELQAAGYAAPLPAERVALRLALAPTRVLWSGWIRDPEVVAGHAVWASAAYGEGELELFGFSPHYRGWSQQAFSLLFRALLAP